MNVEDQVRTIFQTCTDDLRPRSDLLADVQRGGARRKFRGRVAMAMGTVVVIAAAAVGAWTAFKPGPTIPAADQAWLNAPTRGNLAGDSGYLKQAASAWDDSHGKSMNAERGIFDHLRGAPHVVWAGKTPVGNAAFIVQESYLRQHDEIQIDHEGSHLLMGFVGPGSDGKPVIIGDTYPAPGSYEDGAFLIGKDDHTLVVLDQGKALDYSTLTINGDGTVHRTFAPVKFHDGAAVISIPANVQKYDVALTGHGRRSPSNSDPSIANNAYLGTTIGANAEFDYKRLPRSWNAKIWVSGRADRPKGLTCNSITGSELAKFTDPYAQTSVESPPLCIYGITANGSRFAVMNVGGFNFHPSWIEAIVEHNGKRQDVYGGTYDKKSALWVHIRLPDQQGWIIGRDGAALAYQTGDDQWHTVTSSAALIPDNARQVKVTVGGTTQIFLLR